MVSENQVRKAYLAAATSFITYDAAVKRLNKSTKQYGSSLSRYRRLRSILDKQGQKRRG